MASIAHAADDKRSLQTCLEMQNKGETDKALECYKQVAQAQHAHRQSLADEWTPTAGVPLKAYKQNYFLFAHTDHPNNAPTSPHAKNRVPFSYPLDQNEVKFQVSVKGNMLDFGRHTIWGAYSQQSFWQFFDTKHSNPFRESNYEPELIYSYRPEAWGSESTLAASFINAGMIVHQSNGQSLPRSRSWNRMYVQAGLEHDFGSNGRLAILPRYWKRVLTGGPDNDNPDILDYLGHGDLELRYYNKYGMLSAIARSRSLELDLAILLSFIDIKNSNLHLQYFHGYGESLIDYNQAHTTIGVGLSIPFEDGY